MECRDGWCDRLGKILKRVIMDRPGTDDKEKQTLSINTTFTLNESSNISIWSHEGIMGNPAERDECVDPRLSRTRYFCSTIISDAITALSIPSPSWSRDKDAGSLPPIADLNHATGLLPSGRFAG